MTQAEFLFLGTGASSGIPMIGCACPVCTSSNPHNKRLRPSGLLICGDKRLLIDCGPDFRCQALQHHINKLDGLLLTHTHFDHIAGIDDLRVYYLRTRKPLPVLLSESTFQDLKRRYEYLFREKTPNGSLTAQLEFHMIDKKCPFVHFLGLKIGHMEYDQGGMPVIGYRFGPFAYVSDIRNYPKTIFTDLEGVKILILSALKEASSPMHFSLEEGIAFAQKVGAERTYFTHMGHELDHATTNALLPEGIQLAYDGLKLGFDYE